MNAIERDGELRVFHPLEDGAPLFFVHPVDGDPSCYAALAQHLAPELPLVGFSSPDPAPDSVEALAAGYVGLLLRLQPRGPYRIGGWAACGMVAFEIARQLEGAGEQATLLIIDTRAPDDSLRNRPTDRVTVGREYLKYLFWRGGGTALPPGIEERFHGIAPDEVARAVVEQLRELQIPAPSTEMVEIDRRISIVQQNISAYFRYRPAPFSIPMILFRTTEELPDHPRPPSLGWERLSDSPVEVRPVPGNHFTAVSRRHAPALAREIRLALPDL